MEAEVTDIEFRSMMDGLFCLVFHPEKLIEAYDGWLLQFCESCFAQ